MNEFGTATIDAGQANGKVCQTGKGFLRNYLIPVGDYMKQVTVFSKNLNDLPDDPSGMEVRFKSDFVFTGS